MDERCQAILDELETYLDRECPTAGVEDAIRAHLEDCPPCLARADFQVALRELVRSRCRDAAPSGLAARVASAIEGQS